MEGRGVANVFRYGNTNNLDNSSLMGDITIVLGRRNCQCSASCTKPRVADFRSLSAPLVRPRCEMDYAYVRSPACVI